ncbi:hypothetical protein NQ315_013432 [Exocentrus adspersus]|uniref:Uncharacterized protein n=1 Tax=Exocentrus adspersus TaxID=1586481 RepID=A0AAV8VHZ9_9CUCU|nr:hypothetical protein NQ315_013432 [Exocentrus adspersus]
MDNPTSTLFQGADIKINNSQNNEEEEDIEDQKRRKEELQNLLTNALDDFNYDDSTVNSSTNMSVASFDEIQHNYRQASDPNEQLKVLYDVRVRELNNLRKEFEDYKTQSKNDISSLKNKLLLLEAETRQLKISLKNAEDLLVEKTSDISELKNVINNKDLQLTNYEKTIEKYQIEVCTYQSTINELQLKLTDSGPFSTAAKRFNSEEIQKAHQEQISRLESLLDEQTKISGILEKEKIVLQQDIHNLIEQKRKNEDEDKSTINALTKTLDDAQLQCKNLLDVIEMLTKENNHLQERLHHINNSIQEDNQNKTLNYNVAHTEKLKKMLLDKSIQIDSLNAKLNVIFTKKEFQQCENKEHTKSLIVMQNDIQNYRRIIEDKNQQILNLNFTNRDLQEKIEEMLLQTRNDIQNLSHKYSLPQLEQMTEELKNAEEKVKELQEKLEKSEERRLSLMEKQQKTEQTIVKELKQELEAQILNTKTMEKQKK